MLSNHVKWQFVYWSLVIIWPTNSSAETERQEQLNSVNCDTPFSAATAEFDRSTGTTRASGNVQFCRDNFLLMASEAEWNTKKKIISASGSPVTFKQNTRPKSNTPFQLTLLANSIIVNEYDKSGKLSGDVEVYVQKHKQQIYSKANNLSFQQNNEGALSILTIKGTPALFSVVNTINETLSIRAKEIQFLLTEQKLILIGSAEVSDGHTKIAAEQLRFNLIDKSWVAPANDNGVLSVIQLNETPQ